MGEPLLCEKTWLSNREAERKFCFRLLSFFKDPLVRGVDGWVVIEWSELFSIFFFLSFFSFLNTF